MKADLIRLAVVPYFVLLLLICNWNVKLYGAVTLHSFYYVEFLIFILCGLALAVLCSVPRDTFRKKGARIIVIVNLVVLLILYLIAYGHVLIFFEIRYFYPVLFLLFGYYLYLLFMCFRKGEKDEKIC